MICRHHADVSDGVRSCARCGAPFCKDCLVEIQGQPYCATCKSEQLLDVRSGVDRTALDLAGTGRRCVAQLLDGLFMLVPLGYFSVGIFAGGNPYKGSALLPCGIFFYLVIGFGMSILYEAMFLSYVGGQTLGKKAMRLKVVSRDGSDVSAGQAWGRALGRGLFEFLSIPGFLFDYLPAFFTVQRTTLHDMMAGTRVIRWA